MPKGMQKTSWLLYGFAAFFVSLFGYIYYTYETTRNEIITHVDNKLFNAAVSVKHILGDDYHDRVNAGLAISPAVYKEKSRALSEYAKQIDNSTFKLLKRNLPGPYTFILPGSNNLPTVFKKKKTVIPILLPDP